MKLAEAKSKITEIEERVIVLRDRLKKGPLNTISGALEELNQLSGERQRLQIALSQVESETFVVGSSLRDLAYIVEAVESRIASLLDLKQRDDLPSEVSSNIFDQIDSFTKMRNQLKNSIEKTYWQADLEIQNQFGDRSPIIEQQGE